MKSKKTLFSLIMLSLGLSSCKIYSELKSPGNNNSNQPVDNNIPNNTEEPIKVDPTDNPGGTPIESDPSSPSGDNPGSGNNPGGSGEGSNPDNPGSGDNPGDSGGGSNPDDSGSGDNPGGSGGGSNPDNPGSGDNPGDSGEGSNPDNPGSGDNPGGSGDSGGGPNPGDHGSEGDSDDGEDYKPGESEEPYINETILDSKGEGFTYLDDNSEEKFISWTELEQGNYIIQEYNEKLISINLSSFGRGTLDIPTTFKCTSFLQTNQINHLVIGGASLNYRKISDIFNCAIKKITIKDGATKLLDRWCENLSYLKEVVFPETIEEIGSRAFSGCIKLTTIDLSHTKLKTISPYLFNSCSSLTSVIFPSTIDGVVGHFAFANCTELTTANIPNGISKLTAADSGDNSSSAFYRCEKLKNIYLNSSLKIVPARAFANCVSCEFIVDAKIEIAEYEAFKNCYKLSNIDLSNAKFIASYAFIETKVTNANCPNYTAQSIDSYSFCKANLESVFFSSSVSLIGDKAFYDNPNLKSARADSNVSINTIKSEAFYNCTSLDDVNFLTNTSNIGSSAFENCGTITSNGELFLMSHQVDSWAFANTKLKEVKYQNPNNAVGFVGEGHFKNCKELTKFTYYDNILNFSSLPSVSAFEGCENLEELILTSDYSAETGQGLPLDEGITKIQEAENMFSGCNKLSKITFSGTVENWLKSTYTKTNSTIAFITPLGEAINLVNSNCKLQVICQKGEASDTSKPITLTKDNVNTYLSKVFNN